MNIEIPKENLTIEQIIFEKYPVPKAAATMIIPTIISYICASYPKHRSIKTESFGITLGAILNMILNPIF